MKSNATYEMFLHNQNWMLEILPTYIHETGQTKRKSIDKGPGAG